MSSKIQSYLAHFLSQTRKTKRTHSKKNSSYFQKRNFLAQILKKILIFSYVSGNGTFSSNILRKFLIFFKTRNRHFSAQPLKRLQPQKKFIIPQERETFKNFIFNFLHQNFFPSDFFQLFSHQKFLYNQNFFPSELFSNRSSSSESKEISASPQYNYESFFL